MITPVNIDRQREPLGGSGIAGAHGGDEVEEERDRFLIRQDRHGRRCVDIGQRDLTVFHRDAEGFGVRRALRTADAFNGVLADAVDKTLGRRFQLQIRRQHAAEAEDRDLDRGADMAGAADAVRKRDQLCLIRRENDINTTV